MANHADDRELRSKVRPLRAPADARPTIRVTTDEHEVTEQCVRHLAAVPGVFQRGGELVHVVQVDGKRAIARMTLPRIREALSEGARFERWNAKAEAWQVCNVPQWGAQQVEARGEWPGVPWLEGISEAPVLRPDGSVVQAPGYDIATRLLFAPAVTFPQIPSTITRADAQASADILLEPFCDFPFARPEHRSAVVSGVLTPLARYAFVGPAPLLVITKNVRGAGGSLLADVIGNMVTGRAMARLAQAKDDDEERKRILAIARAGDPLVLIDNIAQLLGSPALDAALTGTEIRDRILGMSSMVTAPLRACWYATGNNIVYGGDTLRRVLPVVLESPEERPEERSGFRYPNLLEHVQEHRARYVTAALTILAGYVRAGYPASQELKPWGSFEGWSQLVRGALVWAGFPDPAAAREELVDVADSEAQALRQLIAGWLEVDQTRTGVKVAYALELLADPENKDRYANLREALAELCPTQPGKLPTALQVAKKLKHFQGRNSGGLKLVLKGKDRLGIALWTVTEVSRGG